MKKHFGFCQTKEMSSYKHNVLLSKHATNKVKRCHHNGNISKPYWLNQRTLVLVTHQLFED